MKQHLFFDLDGTLSDPMLGITHSVQHALKKYGITVDNLQQLCPFIGPPLQDSFQDFYGFSKEEADQACEYYNEYFLTKGLYENTLYPGMKEFLQLQANQGKTLYVATSKPEQLARQILEYFGIDSYFHYIGGDTMQRTRSAKAKVIRYVMETNNLADTSAILMIGDRKHDIIGAKETGIQSVGVLYGYGDRKELVQAGADYIVEDLEELGDLLSKN